MKTPTILGAQFSTLVAFALARGMSLQEVQEVSGLEPDEIVKPDTRLPETRMAGLWQELFRRFPNDPLPIDYVRSAPLTAIAGMAYSARYANDVRQIFELIIRSQKYASEGCILALEEDGDEAHFTVSHAFDLAMQVPNEVLLAICWRALTEVLSLDIKAKSVNIGRMPSSGLAAYEAFFGVPILVRPGDYRLTIDRSVLDRPSKDRNEELSSFAEQFFKMAIEKENAPQVDSDYSTLLNSIALNAERTEFRVESIAKDAAMSRRKAQRVAAENGTTLTALIRDARFSRAKHLLLDQQISLIEVAYIVGYSDDRAFRRAFKSHLGMTPSEFRLKTA